ncbi:hypothetical protein WG906_14005 [Pedobacter sp. P351]|uniref:hypothetical protein n=1 Tax=Pedobacter superstes TaxID=3133441 RepID=UPI0030A04873
MNSSISLQAEFDSIFKESGGYFDPTVLIKPELLNNIINGSQLVIQNLQKGNAKLPDVFIAFIDNGVLNAAVTKNADKYFIGINIGTFFLLNDIFFRMLSNRHVLTDFGDCSKESEGNKIFNPQITDVDILFSAKEPSEKITPKDIKRFYLAQLLSSLAMKFLFLHEYAHIIYGHLDFYIDSTKACTLVELLYSENNNDLKRIEPLISQTLEMDADCFAVNIAMQDILFITRNTSLIKEQISFFYNDLSTSLRIWLFAVYSLFRLFGASTPKETDLKRLSHPPPGIRQHIIFATMHTIFQSKPETNILQDIPTICVNTLQEVEEAFQQISYSSLNSDAIRFAYKQSSFEHVSFLLQHWNTVRPLLEKYAYANLAPLH